MDLDAEKTILGSILLQPALFGEAAAQTTAEDYQHPGHRELFRVMGELESDGHAIELGTVSGRLGSRLSSLGGVEYLVELQGGVVTFANLAYYLRRVASQAKRARWSAAFAEIAARGRGAEDDDAAFFDFAQWRVLEIDRAAGSRGGPVGARALLNRMLSEAQNPKEAAAPGVRFGHEGLDGIVGGLRAGHLCVIGGTPGSGKSSLLAQAAAHSGDSGVAWLIFSLEMPAREVIAKIVATEGINTGAVLSGNPGTHDLVRLTRTVSRLSDPQRIWVDDGGDQGALSMADIRSRARRWRRTEAKDFAQVAIWIDYFQLVRTPTSKRESRRELLDQISHDAKALAKGLECPVVLLSSLNRETMKGARRPILSDLRETGALESDADLVLFVHRPELHCQDEAEKAELEGKAEFLIAKYRHGRTGIQYARFDGTYGRFLPADGGRR